MREVNRNQLIILLLLLGFWSACSDYGYDDASDLPLDTNLYGTWVYGSGDDETSWTFKSDGTCIQYIYYQEYEWEWGIEDGKLKLFVDNGIPAYKTYKIEGNKLYYWSESIDDWGLPFTKE